ncbi:aminotransferase class IV [Hyphobacterium sp.]|uniref:aminotransferase class IV n=1 Tax=Hyphobacterium sp. TaxID=2004662 RepID=UPI003BA8A983
MTVLTLDQGRYRPFRAGDLDPMDRGLLLGDGVFETFRIAEGEIAWIKAHSERLAAACAAFDLPDPDWTAISDAVSRHDGPGRVTVLRGPGPRGLGVIADPEPVTLLHLSLASPPPHQISLQVSQLRRLPGSLTARHKTLSYAENTAARREAVAAGADMALLLTVDGHVSGADCANVFWIADGRIYTPSMACAIRPGVMRERVMAAAAELGLPVSEGSYQLSDLQAAGHVFLTNSVMGVVPAYLPEHGLMPRSPMLEALRSAIRG